METTTTTFFFISPTNSEKARTPAWCDRILWKGQRIEQLRYDCVTQLRQSDHKPVYAVFVAQIQNRDEEKFKKIHEEVLKTVDKYENDNQPMVDAQKIM
jgi:inositol polyphosphate 5-phosphatase INPP5B/F